MALRARTLRIVLTPVNSLAVQSRLSPRQISMSKVSIESCVSNLLWVNVHKSFLVATIIKTQKNSLQPSYQKKRFCTFNSDLNRFADWLHENDCLDVCIESTGKYWVPVFNILEKRNIRAVIANPK